MPDARSALDRRGKWVRLRDALPEAETRLAFLTQVAALAIGSVTAYLVATRFSPSLQGFYFSFNSLVSLQFLAEMGLGQAVVALASHEWSALRFDERGTLVGDSSSRRRLLGLARVAIRWNGFAAIGFLLVVSGIGAWLFARAPSAFSWRGPWFALCALVALNLCMVGIFGLLQGCGEVLAYWRYRLFQQTLNGPVVWIAILSGAALWTGAIAAGAAAAFSLFFLARSCRPFVREVVLGPEADVVGWRREVWPLQWRVGVSWLSGYAVTLLLPSLTFHLMGPVSAGRMGLTVTLCSVVIALASSWLTTKSPRFGVLVARRQFSTLESEFVRALRSASIMSVTGAGIIVAGIFALKSVHSPLSSRVLDLAPASLLLAAPIVATPIVAMSIYLRAYRRDPLAPVAAFSAPLSILLAMVFGARFGEAGVAGGYLAAVAFIQLPVTIHIFHRTRRALQPVADGGSG